MPVCTGILLQKARHGIWRHNSNCAALAQPLHVWPVLAATVVTPYRWLSIFIPVRTEPGRSLAPVNAATRL